MAVECRNESERLLAEHAILAQRAVLEAMRGAAHGQGLATVEAAVLLHGQALLKQMMQQACSAHEGVEKKGETPNRANAAKPCVSKAAHRSG